MGFVFFSSQTLKHISASLLKKRKVNPKTKQQEFRSNTLERIKKKESITKAADRQTRWNKVCVRLCLCVRAALLWNTKERITDTHTKNPTKLSWQACVQLFFIIIILCASLFIYWRDAFRVQIWLTDWWTNRWHSCNAQPPLISPQINLKYFLKMKDLYKLFYYY